MGHNHLRSRILGLFAGDGQYHLALVDPEAERHFHRNPVQFSSGVKLIKRRQPSGHHHVQGVDGCSLRGILKYA